MQEQIELKKYNEFIESLLIIAKKRRYLARRSLDNLTEFLGKLRKNLSNQDNVQAVPFQKLLREYQKQYGNEEVSELLLRLASFYYSQDQHGFTNAAHSVLNKLIYPHSRYTQKQVSQVEMVAKFANNRLIKFTNEKALLQNLLLELTTDKPVDILLQSYLKKISALELCELLPNGIYACNHIYFSTLNTLLNLLSNKENLDDTKYLAHDICEIKELYIQPNSSISSNNENNIRKAHFHKKQKLDDEKHDFKASRNKYAKLSPAEQRDLIVKIIDSPEANSTIIKIISNLSDDDRVALANIVLSISKSEDSYILLLLPFLPESIRVEFVIKHQTMIQGPYHVVEILDFLPLATRLDFVKQFSNFITRFSDLDNIISRLHPRDVLTCTKMFSFVIPDIPCLVHLLLYFNEDEDVLSLILENRNLITQSQNLVNLLPSVDKSNRLIIIKKFKHIIKDLDKLVQFLELLPNTQRSILLNEFDNFFRYKSDLLQVIKYLPESEQLLFVNKHKELLKFGSHLLDIIVHLPATSHLIFINDYRHLITSGYELAGVLTYLPLSDRFDFAIAYKNVIKHSIDLTQIFNALPENKRATFAMQMDVKIDNIFELLRVVKYLSTNRFEFLMKYQDVIRNKQAANFDRCLSNPDRAIIGPEYQKAGSMFNYIMNHLNSSEQKLFANEFKETNETDGFLFKRAFPSNPINFNIRFGQSWFNGKKTSINPTCTIELESDNTFTFDLSL